MANAERVKFAFTREGKILQAGTIEIDLNDPTDPEEIRDKLKELDFASFRVIAEEWTDTPKFQFQPYIEDPS